MAVFKRLHNFCKKSCSGNGVFVVKTSHIRLLPDGIYFIYRLLQPIDVVLWFAGQEDKKADKGVAFDCCNRLLGNSFVLYD
jgi:hypothetical protein